MATEKTYNQEVVSSKLGTGYTMDHFYIFNVKMKFTEKIEDE